VADLDAAVLHRIDDLQAGDDFARGENLDLEFAVGRLAHGLGHHVGAAVNGFQRLRPTRRHPPLDDRHRLRDGRRCNRGGRGKTDARCLEKLTTFHPVTSLFSWRNCSPAKTFKWSLKA
jgi:hypothetical protein